MVSNYFQETLLDFGRGYLLSYRSFHSDLFSRVELVIFVDSIEMMPKIRPKLECM